MGYLLHQMEYFFVEIYKCNSVAFKYIMLFLNLSNRLMFYTKDYEF